jgi:NAD(P)-dependent dehydrogenase (short-subunit alcohol dehydrogenase family)
MLLQNKVALITGASSGIGKATARLFAQNGAQIVVAARHENALTQISDEIRAQNGQGVAIQTDVTRFDDCKNAIKKAVSEFGRLDILVNAAGIIGTGSVENTRPEDWAYMMDVNLNGIFYLMHLAVPHLQKTKGTIVNVSSVTGLRAFPNILAYCVSKAGLDQMTRCAALDLAPKGIRVNAVNPGVVATNLHRSSGFSEEKYQAFLEHSKTTHPLGRVGTPEEIAESILFLASEKSGWITGETLSIDGGRHLTCAR